MKPTRLAPLTGIALALLLAGCATPPPAAPQLDLPPATRAQPPAGLDRWWEGFKDPVLQALVEEALAHNSSLQVAAERIQQSRGALAEARSAQIPSLNATLDPSRSRNSEISERPDEPPVSNRVKGGFSASWEIDLWGRLANERQAAEAMLTATAYGREGLASSVAAQTVRSYLTLLALDTQVALITQNLANQAEAVALQRKRFAAGASPEAELKRAEAEHAQASAAQPAAHAARTRAEAALAVLLGRSPREIMNGRVMRGQGLALLEPPPEIPSGLDAELLLRRPDVREAEARLVAADASVQAARTAYFPRLSLTGFFGGESRTLASLFDSPFRSWTLAGALLQPISGLAVIGSRIDTARSVRNEAVLRYEDAARNAYSDVRSALSGHKAARDVLEARSQSRTLQTRLLALAELRLKHGTASQLEVLDNERQRLQAERDYLEALRDRWIALVDVYQAMGGGWAANQPLALVEK